MRRRRVLAVLAAIVASVPPARGQPATERPRRIAIVSPGADPQRPAFIAFKDALRQLGHVESRSFVLQPLLAAGRMEALAALADQAVRSGVDIIVADGRTAAVAALSATKTIPIVAAVGVDPVDHGMVRSLARPGGNLTGITMLSLEVSQKQLELLVEIAPWIRRLAVLHGSPASTLHDLAVEAAHHLGLEARLVRATTKDEVKRLLTGATLHGIDGVVVTPDPVTAGLRHTVVALLNNARLPAVYMEREYAEIGGLMSYGVDLADVFRQLAGYVDRILRGARPAEMPIERPSRLVFVLNLRTARALDLTIPPLVLARADEVIE